MERIDENSLRELWESEEQGHVFQYLDQLSISEKNSLFSQLRNIDVKEIKTIKSKAEQAERDLSAESRISPIDSTSLHESSKEQISRWNSLGEELISQGKVAALVLAGGQGSRLGSALPKGMYNIDLLSQKSLFQIHAERILKVQKTLNATIPLYVMTSEATDLDTKKFFQMNKYFGLKEKDLIFFKQGMIPAIDFEGKIFMENSHSLFLAPDGNGGLFKALLDLGILEDMKKRGIEWISQYCVDNILCQVVDSVFIGFATDKNLQVGCKAVERKDANEKMGVFALKNSLPTVVEYSEINSELAKSKDSNGKLLLHCGHICENLFHVSFLESASKNHLTKYHIARKKIPILGSDGKSVTPSRENGMKFEQFIFDPFEHFSGSLGVLEVSREDEFAALKNASGNDCPETSRKAITELHKKWILEAGGKILDAEDPEECQCEISPLVSLKGEGLEDIVKGKEFQMPFEITIHEHSGKVVIKNWNFITSKL